MILWTALSLWIAALWWFLYLRLRMTVGRQRRRIAFRPAGSLTPEQLFGILLSGSLAVLEQDDFNQLQSAVPVRHARRRLAMHGPIDSPESWSSAIDGMLQNLGALSARERSWIDRWTPQTFKDTEGWNPLQDVCTFLCREAGVVGAHTIRPSHLNTMAWDIQQAAYMVRLGIRAGYVDAGVAEGILQHLRREARRHYGTWNDYFLSSLIGMGMRNHVDIFSPGDWHRIAQTYLVLLSSGDSLLRHAASWPVAGASGPNEIGTARGPMHAGRTTLPA